MKETIDEASYNADGGYRLLLVARWEAPPSWHINAGASWVRVILSLNSPDENTVGRFETRRDRPEWQNLKTFKNKQPASLGWWCVWAQYMFIQFFFSVHTDVEMCTFRVIYPSPHLNLNLPSVFLHTPLRKTARVAVARVWDFLQSLKKYFRLALAFCGEVLAVVCDLGVCLWLLAAGGTQDRA